jgi:hypothetical protein
MDSSRAFRAFEAGAFEVRAGADSFVLFRFFAEAGSVKKDDMPEWMICMEDVAAAEVESFGR